LKKDALPVTLMDSAENVTRESLKGTEDTPAVSAETLSRAAWAEKTLGLAASSHNNVSA
jgi:hypothetical protein